MDDIVSDWYDEDDGESQFPRAAEDGWGIDESEYTSTLDTSKLTPEQIRVAEMLAKQIQVRTPGAAPCLLAGLYDPLSASSHSRRTRW